MFFNIFSKPIVEPEHTVLTELSYLENYNDCMDSIYASGNYTLPILVSESNVVSHTSLVASATNALSQDNPRHLLSNPTNKHTLLDFMRDGSIVDISATTVAKWFGQMRIFIETHNRVVLEDRRVRDTYDKLHKELSDIIGILYRTVLL